MQPIAHHDQVHDIAELLGKAGVSAAKVSNALGAGDGEQLQLVPELLVAVAPAVELGFREFAALRAALRSAVRTPYATGDVAPPDPVGHCGGQQVAERQHCRRVLGEYACNGDETAVGSARLQPHRDGGADFGLERQAANHVWQDVMVALCRCGALRGAQHIVQLTESIGLDEVLHQSSYGARATYGLAKLVNSEARPVLGHAGAVLRIRSDLAKCRDDALRQWHAGGQ